MMLSHSLLSNGGNHTDDREENDFYATEPAADLLNKAEWSINRLGMIWECACGQGHLSKRFDQLGYHVFSSDKINRGFGVTLDFLEANEFTTNDNALFEFPFGYYDIVTNPPYRLAHKFIEKGNELIHHGNKLCLFLKLTYLEAVGRDELFKQYPVSRIHVCRKRIKCAKNGDFTKVQSSPTCYAWFVWEKGYTGPTIIDRV